MENQTIYEDEILDVVEAANFLKIAARTLQRRRADSGLPGHVAGRRCLFLKSELTEWLRSLPGSPANRVMITRRTLAKRRAR